VKTSRSRARRRCCRPTLAGLIETHQEVVQNAPIAGRNIINIIQLTPGASEGASNATISGNRPDDRRQTSAVSINGNPENDNLQLVDAWTTPSA